MIALGGMDWKKAVIENVPWVFSGIGVALLGPLLALLRERSTNYPTIPPAMIKALTDGVWAGSLEDVYVHPNGEKVKETITLAIRKNIWSSSLVGSLTVNQYTGKTTEIVLENGIVRDRHVLFQFRNKDEVKRNLGVIFLRLSDLGTEILGFWTGWSPWGQCYACGKMELIREPKLRTHVSHKG